MPTGTPAPITYTKDDGRLKMEETYNSNGLLFSTIIYEYDNKGRLVKQAEFGINDAPTGYKSFEMNQIRDLVKKYDLYLFSDEVYREFIYTGSPYISACHLEGIEQNVVLIDSVSKRYSECGIRIGALITKNAQVRQSSTYDAPHTRHILHARTPQARPDWPLRLSVR